MTKTQFWTSMAIFFGISIAMFIFASIDKKPKKKKKKKSISSSSKCKDCGISAKFSSGYCLGCEPDDDEDDD
jgi:hypothetical protein